MDKSILLIDQDDPKQALQNEDVPENEDVNELRFRAEMASLLADQLEELQQDHSQTLLQVQNLL